MYCGVLTVCVVCPLRAMVVTRVTPDSAPPRQVNIGAGAWSRPWSDPWSGPWYGPWCPRQVNITGANGANQPSQDIAPRSRPWSAVEFSNFDLDVTIKFIFTMFGSEKTPTTCAKNNSSIKISVDKGPNISKVSIGEIL